MTLGQVQSAEVIHRSKESFYRVRVWEHKTTQAFGSASLIVPLEIYTMLTSYIESLRNGADAEDKVFVTSLGNQLAKASDDLKYLAQHFGEDISLTPTLHRKNLATRAAKNLKDKDVRKVAAHMTHDVNTARKYYQVQQDKDTAMEAYTLLNVSNLLFLNWGRQYCVLFFLQTKRSFEQVDQEEKENLSPQPKKSKPSGTRTHFTEEQEKTIRTYFDLMTRTSLESCRRFLELHKDDFPGRTDKMIQDKCKTMRKNLQKKETHTNID